MIKRLIIFILICSSLQGFNAIAQDFIVTKSGDTLKGTLNKNFLGKLILHVRGDKEIEVSIEEVKSYYFATKGTLFIAKEIPKKNKPSYVEALERGRINLYEYKVKTPEGIIITTWFATKDNDVLEDIITSQLFSKVKPREELFIKLISDNDSLLAAYKLEKKYNFDVKRNYIKSYNLAAR